MAYDTIIKALENAKTDEDALGVMFSSIIGMTWGDQTTPEMKAKVELVTKFCKMYLGGINLAVQIDVTTRNVDLRIINEEWGKYPPGSEASVAIWKIKERLSQ